MTEEEWRVVPGHPDYDVSNLGRVRSWKRALRGYEEPRILDPSIHPIGYIRVKVDNIGYGIHQLVAATFIGACPRGKEVDHINNIRNDNRPENLRYLTRQENMARVAEKPPATHCGNGHLLTGDNLYIRPSNGRRVCKTCQLAYVENRRQRLDSRAPCSMEDCDRPASCRLRTSQPICEPCYQKVRRTSREAAA